MKSFLSNRWILLSFEIVFFILIFVLSIIPINDFDIWFHVKSGEIIARLGIIHYDVFSFNTAGREWFPYEWLFQIIAYYYQQIFGLYNIPYLTAAVVTLLVGNVYFTVRRIFNLNRLLSFYVCFLFFVSVYEFLSARPHIFAYTFLLINLNLLLLYFFKNKNYLWASIPITIAWANLHGSIFLDVAIFGAYASLAFLYWRFPKLSPHQEPKTTNYELQTTNRLPWLSKFRTLSIYTLATALCTVLPPLYFTQYRLLWIFFQQNSFISKYIDEWTPLSVSGLPFYFYSVIFILLVLLFFGTAWRNKQLKETFWAIPLLALPLSAYSASRNVFLGYITLALMLGWILSKIRIDNLAKSRKWIFTLIILALLAFYIMLFRDKTAPQTIHYPIAATQFIADNDLHGHMYNEYGFGGYLLYYLYPRQKVFFDGRTDLYLCCEMRDTMGMATKKNETDPAYKAYLDGLWDKYQISFVLIPVDKHSVNRKIATILLNDPSWSLVFWDDDSQMFVRHDGRNDNVLKQFAVTAATPYNRDPFKKNMENEALAEYQRMIQISDSAKSRNAIGYIYLLGKKYDLARSQFIQAIKLDPSNESPYMNLAELSAYDQNFGDAIRLYEAARKIAPDRGMVYLRLGQLYIQANGDTNRAREIWQEGVKNTNDAAARKQLENLLSKI